MPVFTYWGSEITTESEADLLWETMEAADELNYLLSAAVYATTSGMTNGCGIV